MKGYRIRYRTVLSIMYVPSCIMMYCIKYELVHGIWICVRQERLSSATNEIPRNAVVEWL